LLPILCCCFHCWATSLPSPTVWQE
jgi:hypothetical protein